LQSNTNSQSNTGDVLIDQIVDESNDTQDKEGGNTWIIITAVVVVVIIIGVGAKFFLGRGVS
jgi:flagellar basal body-associated protein FliL